MKAAEKYLEFLIKAIEDGSKEKSEDEAMEWMNIDK